MAGSFTWGTATRSEAKDALTPKKTIAADNAKKAILDRYSNEFKQAEADFLKELIEYYKAQREADANKKNVKVEENKELQDLKAKYARKENAEATERHQAVLLATHKRIEELQKIKDKTDADKALLDRLVKSAVNYKKAQSKSESKLDNFGVSYLPPKVATPPQTTIDVKSVKLDEKTPKPEKEKPKAIVEPVRRLANSLYAREFGEGPEGKINLDYIHLLSRAGVLASEMETATLFIQSQLYNHELSKHGEGPKNHVLAGAILSIIASPEEPFEKSKRTVQVIEDSISLGIEAFKTLAMQELFS